MYAPALALLLALGADPVAAAHSAEPARGAPRDPSAAGGGPADPDERRRAATAKELVRLGARLQREIERGDVGALVARIPEEGLRCAGRVVPRQRVEKELRTPGSWLHRVLLGEGDGAARGAPASLRAFFREAPEVAVVVGFRSDPAAGPLGRPCLDFRAPGLRTPGAPLCFFSRGGRWWLTESLYPCG